MQVNAIRNERAEVTTDDKEITRIVRTYYKKLYANKPEKKKWTNSQNHTIFQN